MSRNITRRKGKGHKTISIIVDGETEIWYLQMMKKNEKLNKITIKPELPKKKKLAEQYELVIANSKDYDKVIWIIDFDTLIKEDKEKKKGEKLKTIEFKEYYKKLENDKKIVILVNNPCLEYWYLQHFKGTSKYYDKCENVCRDFKNTVLSNYKKSEKYYKNQKNDIYTKLYPFKHIAIDNSKKLGNFNEKYIQEGKAEIFKLFEILNIN